MTTRFVVYRDGLSIPSSSSRRVYVLRRRRLFGKQDHDGKRIFFPELVYSNDTFFDDTALLWMRGESCTFSAVGVRTASAEGRRRARLRRAGADIL